MKRVRFASPLKVIDTNIMNYDTECHSPRPFVEKQPLLSSTRCNGFGSPRLVPYTNDPIQKFEFSNSLPYPTINKTHAPNFATVSRHGHPSSDLDLSILDSVCQQPRSVPQKIFNDENINSYECYVPENILESMNPGPNLPNILNKNDEFFLKRENIANLNSQLQLLPEHINRLTLEKENNPLVRKQEIMEMGVINNNESKNAHVQLNPYEKSCCSCRHCRYNNEYYMQQQCFRFQRPCLNGNYAQHIPSPSNCVCQKEIIQAPLNAIDKKNWKIEKYENSKNSENLSVTTQSSGKENREPSVSDLFQIIKLQNEQLQLLQEKVDKFIASTCKNDNVNPAQKCLIDQTSVGSNEDHQKISIGVMTSFEMVRTSTVINKEVIKQTEAQIQCNRSQISIKEVVSKSQPVNINFLEGIHKRNDTDTSMHNSLFANDNMPKNTGFEDKTLNEFSLYNLQVNNDTTPQMSPEPSLYLDVKDYSDTDTDSDDPANVGWTYYNKVMTRVNGLLQDSDMPSSASALYRNTKHLMQIDKTNVSVTKRVTFGDNLVQPRAPSTDTSLKMNQLAAKYLNNGIQATTKSANDLSFATKNYMEKHRIIQGNHQARPQHELPKFLDVTVLKQQQKLL